jgi:hypothetical protein
VNVHSDELLLPFKLLEGVDFGYGLTKGASSMNAITADPQADACCGTCGSRGDRIAFEIACTLGAGDFKERVAGIRDLASRALIRSERKPLQLSLTYTSEALAEVEQLVVKESECCSFLDFDMRRSANAVQLIITAPVEALAAVDELFAHFAPELAKVAA